MLDPNYQVTWLPQRPEFVIQRTGGSGRMCYSETEYEVVSRRQLDREDFERLSDSGLLGIGQAYHILHHEAFEDAVPPVTIDLRTGKPVDVPPVNGRGEPLTDLHAYEYHRYKVRRICDSGD